jgi:WD40 repeat protein
MNDALRSNHESFPTGEDRHNDASPSQAPTMPPGTNDLVTTTPPSDAASAAVEQARSDIPGYVILEELGRGGMGVVYKARQTRLDRVVALKMILAGGHAGETELARFRTEAEAIAQLSHLNIVQIYEVGDHAGLPFFSLEYCAGGSLDRKLAGVPLSATEAATLVRTLALAVHAAHQKGVVHRDLKPANVLLAEGGAPKVTDFGLAKRVDVAGPTASNAVMGTPSYMAPEQAAGKSKELGPAVDIYALGAILYECLTGRPPFRGTTPVDTILQVISDDPVPPSQLQRRLPHDLETICLKCLRKVPLQRYVTAGVLADELMRFLNGEPIQARPIGAWGRGLKWVRRRPAVSALVAALFLALASGLSGIVSLWLQANQERDAATSARTDAERDKVAAEKARGEADAQRIAAQTAQGEAERQGERARDQLVRLTVANGVRCWEDGDDFTALLWFAQALQLEQGKPHREYIHRVRLATLLNRCPTLVQDWTMVPGASSADFSPDGRQVLLTTRDRARLWDMASGVPVTSWLKPSFVSGWLARASFRPDAGRFLTRDWFFMQLWDTRSGTPVGPLINAENRGSFVDACFSPDGSLIITPNGWGGAQLWDANTGKPAGPRLAHTDPVHYAAFAPDGRLVATAAGRLDGSRGETRVWNVATGQPVGPALLHDSPVKKVAFSKDGKRLIAVGGNRLISELRVWDPHTAKALAPPLKQPGGGDEGSITPDGRYVATYSRADPKETNRDTLWVWDVQEGRVACPPIRTKSALRLVSFSPDNRYLLSAHEDNRARVWGLPTGAPVGPPLPLGAKINTAVFGPDGNRALIAGGLALGGEVRAWAIANSDAATDVPLAHPWPVQRVILSPDGERAVSMPKPATLWDVKTGGKLVAELSTGGLHGAREVVFSADGRRVVTQDRIQAQKSGVEQSQLSIWDAVTGKLVRSLLHNDFVFRIACGPDGERILSFSGRQANYPEQVNVWDLSTGKHFSRPLTGVENAYFGAFSPNGKRLIAVAEPGLRMWDAQSGSLAAPAIDFPGESQRRRNLGECSVGLSPDGQRAILDRADRTAQIWDLNSGEAVSPPLVGQVVVRGRAFSPDARRVLTVGEDGAARAWWVDGGTAATPPLVHGKQVIHASFNTDGGLILSGAKDGSIRVWDGDTGEPVSPVWQLGGPVDQLVLSPDNRRVLAAGSGRVRFWDLTPEHHTAQQLVGLTQFLARRRIDAAMGLLSEPVIDSSPAEDDEDELSTKQTGEVDLSFRALRLQFPDLFKAR